MVKIFALITEGRLSIVAVPAVSLSGANSAVLESRSQTRKFTLDELVAGITPENRHDETDFGRPVGNEVW